MQTQKHLHEVHRLITGWLSAASLVEDEITHFRNQLNEIAAKNNSNEMRAQIEHFENAFTRHLEVTDEWKHKLKEQEHALSTKASGNPAADHVLVEAPVMLEEEAATYSRIFDEFKQEFRQFLAKSL